MQGSLTALNIMVVPGWIFRSALRNKLNSIDLLDYSKIRPILSLDDMAEWIHLNYSYKINGKFLSECGQLVEQCFTNLKPADKAELLNSVVPLSGSEEIAYNVATKLAGSNPMNGCAYQFVTFDSTVLIILNEGFTQVVTNPDSLSEFVKDYLKECYKHASISEVSRMGIFNIYLKQFKI